MFATTDVKAFMRPGCRSSRSMWIRSNSRRAASLFRAKMDSTISTSARTSFPLSATVALRTASRTASHSEGSRAGSETPRCFKERASTCTECLT